ncbi:FkbM family methyltransferase [Agriterribacter humi]|uniref:FkbM family methyltransferase n=1 Tax=Agriterribacter humi TaxID=1104781 RepID=UPI00126471CD|nr:FkbM family methyltransferase [Agriterribacter humi]
MKRKISRLIKKTLVSLGWDDFVADQYHKTHGYLFKKLIPDRTFYKREEEKTIKRYNTWFTIQPADFTQWLLFRDKADTHVDAALKIINPGKEGLILDIGANCGNFSLIMAQKIKEKQWQKQVMAFEPNPRIFSRISQNLSLNPQIESILKLVNKGVGEKASVLELQLPLRNSGAASLIRNYEHEPHEKHLVDIVSIDDFLADNNTPVEFMKIDVENFEYYVLKGAAKTIEKFKPAIYIEMGKGQLNQAEIFAFFATHCYTLFGEDSNNFVLIESPDAANAERYRNILATGNKEHASKMNRELI